MPVLVEPGSTAPQNLGSQFIAGLDASRSLMDRADANSRANAQAQQQQALYDLAMPLKQAETKANIVKAGTAYDSALKTQEMRATAYELYKKAQDDFDVALHIEDAATRVHYLNEWAGRYSQISNVDELKPEMDAKLHMVVQENLNYQKLAALGVAMQKATEAAKTPFSAMKNEDAQGRVTSSVLDRRTGVVRPVTMEGAAPPAAGGPPAGSEPVIDPATGQPTQAQPQPQIFRSQSTREKAFETQAGKSEAERNADLVKAKPQRQFAVKNVELQSKHAAEDIDDLIGRVNSLTAGAGGTLLDHFPGTAARDLQSDLASVTARIFSSQLQAMRDASKTGGAVGNVSDREGDKIGSLLGALQIGQSPEQLVKNLKKVRDRLKESAELTKAAFDSEYGGTEQTTQDSGFSEAKMKRLQELRAKKAARGQE